MADLITVLADNADESSGRGIRLIRDEHEVERIDYAQLYVEAGQVARGLQQCGVRPGDRVGIALPTTVDFARAFFGILAAGAVAVPLPPPLRFASLEIHLRRIALILRQSDIRVVLSNEPFGRLCEPVIGGPNGEFDIVAIEKIRAGEARYVPVDPDQPALVQYTSGTSTDPRGVVLSHANLLANVKAIGSGLGLTDDDVGVSWLPLFHDLGLIGQFLTPILHDLETVLMPPEEFLRDPGAWLRAISRYRASVATAPNSGYAHALRRTTPDQVAELDLSNWRLAINGAETIDGQTLRDFAHRFAPAGFRFEAFFPVYGLAEGALAVTFPALGTPARSTWVRRAALSEGIADYVAPGTPDARELVSVGVPVRGAEVRITDDEGAQLGDDTVGEIQIRGTSVMRGYESNEQASNAVVCAGGWVSTGDLGFRQHGELFIAGRKKEMIIAFGQNYYASDIESIAGTVAGIASHGVLATSMPAAESGEGLLVFVETKETDASARKELVGQVRLAISSALGLTPTEVVLVDRGRLPRTSSGKLRRYGTEALFRELAAVVKTGNRGE